MEQKDYKLEIIDELLKNSGHIRELAKRLKINHMNIARKVKELAKENIIDFKQEGKNKVYSLKKTIEAKEFIFMVEKYKLLKTLEKYPYLRSIIEKIQKDKKIKLAILFGSYAKGLAKQDSDIDIYIDTTNKTKKELEALDTKLSIKIGKFNSSSLLAKEIIKNHIILKGVEEFYEKNNLFD